MTEQELAEELDRDPFIPFRIHMVSGKTLEVLGSNVAHRLNGSLLVLRNPTLGTSRAEGYDVLAYANIERIERLNLGKRNVSKRKPA